jgi:hypothetical protein
VSGEVFWAGDSLANPGEFYLDRNHSALEIHHISIVRAKAFAARAALSVPTIPAKFTRTQFLNGQLRDTALARKAANNDNTTHSGDIFLIRNPSRL